jgi:hypothetical protein
MLDEQYKRWQLNSPLGLILMGAGLSIITHAAGLKQQRVHFLHWSLLGTLGLVVFNAGVAVFGDAVKARALYEQELRQLNQ